MRRRYTGRRHPCPLALDGVVYLLREGVVDHPDEGLAIEGEREGDGDVRVGVDEVCGAVDGVDDEGWGGGEGARGGGFFAEEGVGGVGGEEGGGDEGFDCFVGFGYEVRGWVGIVSEE